MSSTLCDVADLAGVSVRTVSNVLNGHPHVREAVRQRVLQAAHQLGYHPDPVARALRLGSASLRPLYLPTSALDQRAAVLTHLRELAMQLGLQPAPPAVPARDSLVCLLTGPQGPP